MKPSIFLILGVAVLVWFSSALGFAATPQQEGLAAPSVMLPRTGQVLTYDQAGKVIDFTGSRQDGEFQRGEVWPEPRFIVNEDGTISDSLTGLVWLKDGNCFGDSPWPTVLQSISDFNKGDISCPGIKTKYDDWFVPNLNQLASLIDFQASVTGDALRLVGFNEVQNGAYWASTPSKNQQNAWTVDFANGSILAVSKLERHFLLVARLPRQEKPPSRGTDQLVLPGSDVVLPEEESSTRFLDNGDGSVTDSKTGMVWLQDAACLPLVDWQGALSIAKQLAEGGGMADCPSVKGAYKDWSLPNVVELRSLIDYRTDYPALTKGHPFQRVLSAGYWTATTVAASPDHAFVGELETGAIFAAKKTQKRRVLVVRPGFEIPERPRREADRDRGAMGVDPRYVLGIDPEMISEIKWPPDERFSKNGDGTSLDIITGINWMTDANCFGKKSWKEAVDAVERLNSQAIALATQAERTQASRRLEVKCEGYDGVADDWVMPTFKELLELVNVDVEDRAQWLNKQGLHNVQSSGIYWSGTETPLNLYFADAVTLKTGKAGNYPKSLKFFVWPHRKLQDPTQLTIEPLLNLMANAIGNHVSLSPLDPISLVVSLHTFGLRKPAEYWFWYDTPDEKRLWLTSIRTWADKAKPVYQGPLFNLVNYEIFRSAANGLLPGVYDFHFAVDTIPNGLMDDVRSEIGVSVVITGSGEQ